MANQFGRDNRRKTDADTRLVARLLDRLIATWVTTLLALAAVFVFVAWLAFSSGSEKETFQRFLSLTAVALLITIPLILLIINSVLRQIMDKVHHQLYLRRKSTEDAAHELATPVSILKSRLQVMERQMATDHQLTESVTELADATNRLVMLIDSIRALSRAENSEFYADLSIVNLDRVITQAIAKLQEPAAKSNITVRLDCSQSLAVVADHEGVERIVTNLLSNAIKYGTVGGTVEVSALQNRDNVCLKVTDDGCGIPSSSLPLIFDRFYRVDETRSREAGGSGLGLSIVKAIVDAHGGSITAESTEGKGSAFSVSLPKSPPLHPFALMQSKD